MAEANSNHVPYLCLAIQRSADNPAAEWFWSGKEVITGGCLRVRVGGSFVWPPPSVDLETIDNVIFVAGGMGIKQVSPFTQSISKAVRTRLRS
jgi:hypothetical protein